MSNLVAQLPLSRAVAKSALLELSPTSRTKRQGKPKPLGNATNTKLRIFSPPFGPPDFVGGAGGLHDGPLIGRAERMRKTGQRGLDEPRFEGDSCSLTVAIEFPGHSQRLQRVCDTAGRYKRYGSALGLVSAMPLPGFLDHCQGRTGCSAVAFKPAFCKLEQKGLGSRDTTLDSLSRIVTIWPRTAS
jgi:hypothetical protein